MVAELHTSAGMDSVTSAVPLLKVVWQSRDLPYHLKITSSCHCTGL